MSNPKEVYAARVASVAAMARRISVASASLDAVNADSSGVQWAHVGDLARLIVHMGEVADLAEDVVRQADAFGARDGVRVESESSPPYTLDAAGGEDEQIARALNILASRLRQPGGFSASSPGAVRDYLRLRLAGADVEQFTVLYLDSQNVLIEARIEATGTINAAAVYPRQIVKSALETNAAAVIFAHNHPSGMAEPSQADRQLTKCLDQALKTVDIRVLDHIVVGGNSSMTCTSFADRGWL